MGTGFAYSAAVRVRQARVLAELIGRLGNIRRLGSAALDLCYVGAGRLDAYFEAGLADWDMAAGMLVATEAGARVGALDGQLGQRRLAGRAGAIVSTSWPLRSPSSVRTASSTSPGDEDAGWPCRAGFSSRTGVAVRFALGHGGVRRQPAVGRAQRDGDGRGLALVRHQPRTRQVQLHELGRRGRLRSVANLGGRHRVHGVVA